MSQLTLTGRLRLELRGENGRKVLHAFVDDRELPIDRAHVGAILAAFSGRMLDSREVELLLELGALHTSTRDVAAYGRIVLQPTVALGVRFGAEPRASLPISAFVPEIKLRAAERLAATLCEAWRRMCSAAQARHVAVDLRQAEDILWRVAVERNFELGDQFAVDETNRSLVPRTPLQQDTISHPLVELCVYHDREPGTRAPLRLTPLPNQVPLLGRLLGELATGIAAAALDSLVIRTSPLAAAVAALLGGGFVGATAELSPLALDPGTIMHLGHATLLANLGGEHVLVDPWLPAASEHDAIRPLAPAQLPSLAGIFLTHHHWDHVHPETLLKLSKKVPVFVPRQDSNRPLWPRTDVLLRHLGFDDVRLLAAGDAVSVGDGGRVVMLPFFGEDPSLTGFVGACWLLEHNHARALVHVDSGVDVEGRSLASSSALAAHAPASPVFATRRQELGTRVEYSWEFLLQPTRRWLEPAENCCNDAATLAALCRAARAHTLVLYSEGGADWYPTGTDFLRSATLRACTAPYEFLWDDLNMIRAAVQGVGAALRLSAPYEQFRIGA